MTTKTIDPKFDRCANHFRDVCYWRQLAEWLQTT